MVQHTSPLLPQSTAMSVAVTRSKPPSATVCTAPSSSVDGVPYGSRSTASNIFSCVIMSMRTSPALGTTLATAASAASECFALNSTFRAIDATAVGSRSLATTHPTSSSSRAYLMARRPDAAMPSRMRMGLSGGFVRGASSSLSPSSAFLSPSPPSGSSCLVLYMSSISSGFMRCGRTLLSLGVTHMSPFKRLFFGARLVSACSAARTFWNWRMTLSDRSRLTTCALL